MTDDGRCDLSDYHDDCEFCAGALAYRTGHAKTDNPYPAPANLRDHESPHNLWRWGYRAERMIRP